jgi:hypothetical protein
MIVMMMILHHKFDAPNLRYSQESVIAAAECAVCAAWVQTGIHVVEHTAACGCAHGQHHPPACRDAIGGRNLHAQTAIHKTFVQQVNYCRQAKAFDSKSIQ